MKHHRILPALPILALLLSATPIDLESQALDTVWQVDYQMRIDSYDGKPYPYDTLSIWFNDRIARHKVGKDRYVIIRGDSVHAVDTFHTEVATIELEWMNRMWQRNMPLVWRQRRSGPVRVVREGRDTTIANYRAELSTFDFFTNLEPPYPMRMYVWASDEVPMTKEELKNFYLMRTMIDEGLAIDHGEINDTLLSWGALPFHTRIVSNTGRGVDTSGVPVLHLLSLKRVTMPAEHFEPPPGWRRESVPSPTEEQYWDMTAIPMPGGPKREE